jgi:hypothetical protein
VTPRPDGSFVLVLREMPGGSYRIVACQRCATPNRIEAEAAVSISPATGSPTWPALVAFALVAAAGLLLLRARLRRPRPKGPEKPATTPEISARLVQRAPRVSLTRVGDGSDHVIRLMPHERPAVVHVEEARQS